MSILVICTRCGKTDELGPVRWRCACGGPYALPRPGTRYDTEPDLPGVGRYRPMLAAGGADLDWDAVSLGEGATPVVPLRRHPAGVEIFAKLDYLMPTLSFKDRGAAVLVAAARRLGVARMVADSSGNAGTAIAAYAARAGLPVDVYVPQHTSPRKIAQIGAYGATVHTVAGDRAATAAAAIDAVESTGAFYASHVYNPLFIDGVSTFAYELFEQLDGRTPDLLVLPVGNGTLLLGTHYGMRRLHACGRLPVPPAVLAVQSARCAPIATAYAAGATAPAPVADAGTAAEGIAIAEPPRGEEILAALRACHGHTVAVPEDRIAPAQQALAGAGLSVEPTAAATYAGLLAWLSGPGAGWAAEHRRTTGRVPRAVLPLCGAGLKAM